jgi:hypothetical protein
MNGYEKGPHTRSCPTGMELCRDESGGRLGGDQTPDAWRSQLGVFQSSRFARLFSVVIRREDMWSENMFRNYLFTWCNPFHNFLDI